MDPLEQETLGDVSVAMARPRTPRLTFTIALHPDDRRIGDRVRLYERQRSGRVEVSRLVPLFDCPDGGTSRALLDPGVSRRPLSFEWANDRLTITPGESRQRVLVGETALTGPTTLTAAQVERGLVVSIAERVVLLVHFLEEPDTPSIPGLEPLVGHSDAVVRLRDQLRRVGDLDVPVLLRGESGVGKEVAAQALHAIGPRAQRPLLGVNIAATPATMAAAELFGHVRGAFTGATHDAPGLFRRAHTGTLFLDEIGDAPQDVQVALLRVLETGEVRPVGGRQTETVDVRLIAATDAPLETLTSRGQFRNALLQRLGGYVVHLPALRGRRDDIPRLIRHLAQRELANLGEPPRTPHEPNMPHWLPAWAMRRLLDYSWPGNVRELRNVVRQLVIATRFGEICRPELLDELVPPEVHAEVHTVDATPAPAGPITDDQLITALRAHGFSHRATADALGIARNTLLALIDRSERVPRPRDLSADAIAAALAAHGGNLKAAADTLMVSGRGLRLRMTELGMN